MAQRIDYDISDEQLVFMVNENSEDAKETLYEKYTNLIHKEVNNVKGAAYALGIEKQDLVQEAMLGFASSISSFNEGNDAKFITYATLCIRRRLYRFIEKQATGKKYLTSSTMYVDDNRGTNAISAVESSNREPLNKLMIDESLVEVKKNIENLTYEEQIILDYATEGLKPEAIAKIVGKTPKQIYNILYRARKKIKPQKK